VATASFFLLFLFPFSRLDRSPNKGKTIARLTLTDFTRASLLFLPPPFPPPLLSPFGPLPGQEGSGGPAEEEERLDARLLFFFFFFFSLFGRLNSIWASAVTSGKVEASSSRPPEYFCREGSSSFLFFFSFFFFSSFPFPSLFMAGHSCYFDDHVAGSDNPALSEEEEIVRRGLFFLSSFSSFPSPLLSRGVGDDDRDGDNQ